MPGKQIKSTVFRGFFNKQTQYKVPKGGKMTAKKARELTPEEVKTNTEASLYRPVLRVAYLIRIVRTRQDALSAPQVLAAFKGLDKHAVQTALAVALRDKLLTQEQQAVYASMGYIPRADVQEVDLETEARIAACPMYDSDSDEVVDQGDWDDDWDNQNQNADVSLMWAKPPKYEVGEAIQPAEVADVAPRARTRYLKNDAPLYEIVKPVQPPTPRPEVPVLPRVQTPNDRKLIIGRAAPPPSARPANNIRGHRTRTKRQDDEIHLGEAFTGPAAATTKPDNSEMKAEEMSSEGQAYEPVMTNSTDVPTPSLAPTTTNGAAAIIAATTTNPTLEMPKKKSPKTKVQAQDPVTKPTTTPQPQASPTGPAATTQATKPDNLTGAADAATATSQPTSMQKSEIMNSEAQAHEPDDNEPVKPDMAGLEQQDAILAELGLSPGAASGPGEEDSTPEPSLLTELGLLAPAPPTIDDASALKLETVLSSDITATDEGSKATEEESEDADDDDQGQTVIETSASLQAVIEEVGATFMHMTNDIVTKLGSRLDKGDERLTHSEYKAAEAYEEHRLRANDLELRLASSEEALARAVTQVAAQGDSIAALLAAVAGLTQRVDAADHKTTELAEENAKLRAQVTAAEGKLTEAAVRESDARAEAIITDRRTQSVIDRLASKVQDLQSNMLAVPSVATQDSPALPAEPLPAAKLLAATWSTVTATPVPLPVVLKPRQRPVLKVVINGAERTLSTQRNFGEIQDSLRAYDLEYVEATATVIATPQTRDMQYRVGGSVTIYKLPATATKAEETKQAITLLNTSVIRQVDGVWEQHVLDIAESDKYIASTFLSLGQLPPVGTGPVEPTEAAKTFFAIRQALDYRTSQPAFKRMTAKQVAQEAARLHYSLELPGIMAAIRAADRDTAAKMDRPHVRKVLAAIAAATSTPPAWMTLAAEIGQFEPPIPDGVATHPTYHAPARQPSVRGAARGRGRGGATLSAFMRPQLPELSFLAPQSPAVPNAGSPATNTSNANTPT